MNDFLISKILIGQIENESYLKWLSLCNGVVADINSDESWLGRGGDKGNSKDIF